MTISKIGQNDIAHHLHPLLLSLLSPVAVDIPTTIIAAIAFDAFAIASFAVAAFTIAAVAHLCHPLLSPVSV